MAVTIRRYEIKDIDAILGLCKQCVYADRNGAVNHFKEAGFEDERIRKILLSRIRDNTFFCNIVVEDEKVVGLLAGSIDELVFSTQLIAKDWLLYFDPSFSSVRVVLRLITSYVTWAKSMNASRVEMSNSTGYKQEQYGQLMKLAGFDLFMVGYNKKV